MSELAAADLAAASALRWLDALLERSAPDPGVIASLLDATRSGEFAAPARAAATTVDVPAARSSTLARGILAVQIRNLHEKTFDVAMLRAAAEAVGRLARSQHQGDIDAAIGAAPRPRCRHDPSRR